MRNVSQGFLEASLSPIGYATAYIEIGEARIDASEITDITITESIGEGAYTIGTFTTTEVSMTIVTSALPNVVTAQPIRVYFGYNVNETFEYVPMGVFYAEPRDVSHKNLLTVIRAHDMSWAMTDNYVTALDYTGTVRVSDVLNEIQTALSITYGTFGGLAPSSVRVYEAPQGSYRDVIAQMAMLMGTNAKINRAGSLDFLKVVPNGTPVQDYGAYDYQADNYQLTSNAPTAFGVLTVNYVHEVVTGEGETQHTEEVTETYTYSAPTGSHGITIETGNIRSQAETNLLGEEVLGNGSSYYGYTVTLPGQPQIDLGDVIALTEPLGDSYDFVVLSIIHNFNGAMKSTFSAIVSDEDPNVEGNNIAGSLKEQVTTVANALGRQTRLLADNIAANNAQFNYIEGNYAHITNGVIDNATIGHADVNGLNANYAHLTQGVIDNAKIGYADVNGLNANYAHISNGTIDNAKIGYADVNGLSANYAQIDAANITALTTQQAWVDKLMVQTGLLAQSGTIYTLDAIQVNASNITAGTLDVERLIVTVGGEKYLVQINPSTGTPTYVKLDGGIIEDLTITADKIVAGAITAEKITTQNLVGTGGWINLRNGTFAYSNASTGHGISWDGQHLTISADSILLSGDDIGTSIQNAVDTANAVDSTINGNVYYQYTTGGTTYNVLYDEANDRYYYFDDNEQEVTVTYAQLDKDENDVPITVVSGGIQSQINENTETLGELKQTTEEQINGVMYYQYSPEYSGNIVTFEAESSTGIKSLVANIEPNQSGTGDPSPDNIRPISGWDSVNVTECGKNRSSVNTVSNVKWATGNTDLISIVNTLEEGTFNVSFKVTVDTATKTGAWNYGMFLGGMNFTHNNKDGGTDPKVGDVRYFSETLTITSSNKGKCTSCYLYGVGSNAQGAMGTATISELQIELGTKTDYTPYNGQTYTKSLGRTVYGGTLDLVSGELVVNRAYVDLGTLNYEYINGYFRASLSPSPKIDNSKITFLSSCYKAYKGYDFGSLVGSGNKGFSITNYSSASYPLLFVDSDYTSASAFKTAMNGKQLVYETLSEYAYQLTPEQVQTLLGTNNIWADSGEVSVTLTPYNVIYDEDNDRYYYLTDSGQEVTVTYAQLDKDSGGDPIKVIIGGLSNQISAVDERLGGQIDGLGGQIETLSDETSEAIGGLESRVSTNETTIGSQGQRLNTAESSITNLQNIVIDKYEAFIEVKPSVPSITLGKRNDATVRTRLEITDEVVNFYTDGKNSAKASGKSFESPEGKFEQVTMKTVGGRGYLRWIARSNGHLSLKKVTGDN